MREGWVVLGGRRSLAVGAFALLLVACGDEAPEATTTTTTATSSTTTSLPAGWDVGPVLDPDALDLPATGVVVQPEGAELVVFVGIDGEVLGHLPGHVLFPPSLINPPLRGAGPLVVARGEQAHVLDGDRLVPVPGPPGSLPLGDGAVLVPGHALHLAGGEVVELPRGEIDVSADRRWVTVRAGDVFEDRESVAFSTADGRSVALDRSCVITDTTPDGALVRICGHEIWIGRKLLRDRGPFPPFRLEDGTEHESGGHWTQAVLSPGMDALLLQHSGECESQSGWRLAIGDPGGAPVALGPTDEAWDGGGLGWLADGRVVATFGPGICGVAFPDGPGVYVEARDGSVTLLYGQPPGTMFLGATLWHQSPA